MSDLTHPTWRDGTKIEIGQRVRSSINPLRVLTIDGIWRDDSTTIIHVAERDGWLSLISLVPELAEL